MSNPCKTVYTPCTRSKRYKRPRRLSTVYRLGKHWEMDETCLMMYTEDHYGRGFLPFVNHLLPIRVSDEGSLETHFFNTHCWCQWVVFTCSPKLVIFPVLISTIFTLLLLLIQISSRGLHPFCFIKKNEAVYLATGCFDHSWHLIFVHAFTMSFSYVYNVLLIYL